MMKGDFRRKKTFVSYLIQQEGYRFSFHAAQPDSASCSFEFVSSVPHLRFLRSICCIFIQEVSTTSSLVSTVCASHLGIDSVKDPPNDGCDGPAQVHSPGYVDGETNPMLHAVQDQDVDGVPEDSGEDDGEVDLPEWRHRG